MTLNASGPISLGGSTAGQSVNLELGNSATATASINSTPFRTLANVPSGAIALSNFYGKSNATSWVLYLGQGQTGLSVSASIGTVCFGNYAWSAGRNSGVVAMGVTSRTSTPLTFGIKWISPAGVVTSSIFNGNANATATDPAGIGPLYATGSDVFCVMGNNTRFINTVSANGTAYSKTGGDFAGYTSGSDTPYPNWTMGNVSARDSSGNIVFTSPVANKGVIRTSVAKYSSNLTFQSALIGPNHNSANYINSIFPRSDGTFVAFGAIGNTSANSGRAIFFNSGLTAATATYDIANPANGTQFWTASAFDNVNNVSYMRGYVAGNTIARFDSSFNCTAQVRYFDSTDNYDLASGGCSISYYGGALYMASWSTSTSPSPSFTVLCKLDPTTLAVIWAYKYQYGSSKAGLPPNQYINLFATANGVYFLTRFNSTNEVYLFNISGGSAPTAKTVNIPSGTGGSYTLTISSVTVTTTSLSTWTTSAASVSYSTYGSYTPGWNITTGTATNAVSSTLVSL